MASIRKEILVHHLEDIYFGNNDYDKKTVGRILEQISEIEQKSYVKAEYVAPTWFCPSCGHGVGVGLYIDELPHYCENCGAPLQFQ